jgi:hypothetical protein
MRWSRGSGMHWSLGLQKRPLVISQISSQPNTTQAMLL